MCSLKISSVRETVNSEASGKLIGQLNIRVLISKELR